MNVLYPPARRADDVCVCVCASVLKEMIKIKCHLGIFRWSAWGVKAKSHGTLLWSYTYIIYYI